MVKVAVVGLGKMGLSHLSMVRALPGVEVVGVVDATTYLLGVLKKYTGLQTYTSIDKLLAEQKPDAAVVATPSRLHYPMVKQLLEAGVAVFCEKPFTLSGAEGDELVELAAAKGLVTQVGYHNRFVGAFGEIKRLLDAGAIGTVTHGLAEAYGPVVLKPQGGTWRSKSNEGGGCLYDYAAHPLNLINWYLGEPVGVGGTVLNSVFSAEIDDEVSSTLYYPENRTVSVSVNWSDESVRKMTTRITLWGTGGRIFADRQEIQVYLREDTTIPEGYQAGLERPVHHRTDRAGRLLPARRGVHRPARPLRGAGQHGRDRRDQHLLVGRGHRQADRADDRGLQTRPVGAAERRGDHQGAGQAVAAGAGSGRGAVRRQAGPGPGVR